MAKISSTDRKAWDPELKQEICRKLISGEMTFDAAQKQLKVQPYQLLAWVGRHVLDRGGKETSEPITIGPLDTSASAPAESGEDTMRHALARSLSTGTGPDSDTARRIVEWYIDKYILNSKD